MSTKHSKGKQLRRKRAFRDPFYHFYIFCEGKTEEKYIKAFVEDIKAKDKMVKVIPTGVGGVPSTVVNAAVEKKKELEDKKDKNSFDEKYEVWAVSDVDAHCSLPEAKDKAKGNNIPFCISNPCIEIWALLHLKDHSAYIDRGKLQSLLKEEMNGYDHNKGATFNYGLMEPNYEKAKERAMKLEKMHKANGSDGNPSTNAYKMLDNIIEKVLRKK